MWRVSPVYSEVRTIIRCATCRLNKMNSILYYNRFLKMQMLNSPAWWFFICILLIGSRQVLMETWVKCSRIKTTSPQFYWHSRGVPSFKWRRLQAWWHATSNQRLQKLAPAGLMIQFNKGNADFANASGNGFLRECVVCWLFKDWFPFPGIHTVWTSGTN